MQHSKASHSAIETNISYCRSELINDAQQGRAHSLVTYHDASSTSLIGERHVAFVSKRQGFSVLVHCPTLLMGFILLGACTGNAACMLSCPGKVSSGADATNQSWAARQWESSEQQQQEA